MQLSDSERQGILPYIRYILSYFGCPFAVASSPALWKKAGGASAQGGRRSRQRMLPGKGRGLSPSLRSRAPRLACGRSSLRAAPRRRVLGAAAPLWCPWSYRSAPCRAVPTQLCGRRRCADGGTLPAPAARGHRGRARSGLQPGPVAWVRFPLALRGFAAEKLPTSFEIMRCYADFSLIIFQCVIV